jgi:predicted phosphohydrolase
MALYAISDLHLAMSIEKPMDIFGARWANYMEKLKENWRRIVKDEDYVIVPGDISWATYLEQAYEDFKFMHELPGRKIISKGNHDYWWTTKSKLDKYINENGFTSISFMHNNSYRIGNAAVCGTRGWEMPGEIGFSSEDVKIYQRELQRLELSLKDAQSKMSAGTGSEENGATLIAALHYPPYNSKGEFSGFLEIMKKYGVKLCIYGHLHGEACRDAVEEVVDGIVFRLVSADHLGFAPLPLDQQLLSAI